MLSDDWRRLADRHNTTIEEIKERLPLSWVVSVAAGISLSETGEGRAHGLCPFHTDQNPSLDIYGFGERWGCFPCGKGGDIFDFIGEYWELVSFGARFEKALDLTESFTADGSTWTDLITRAGPEESVTVAEVGKELQIYLDHIKRVTTKPVRDLLDIKGGALAGVDPDWLIRTWNLGTTPMGEVAAGYWDREGGLVSYKTRRPGKGGWYARRGVKLTSLYGEWQLVGSMAEASVWLCEGETDTWLASWLLRGRGIALGLPSGAGSHIRDEWVEMMRDRNVTIVMDSDKAGRRAAVRWWDQIHAVARSVSVTFPESDLGESRRPDMVLDNGRVVTSRAGYTIERGDRRAYQAVSQNGAGEILSNWVLEPDTRIVYYDTLDVPVSEGYEGVLVDDPGKRVRVRAEDFYTASDLRRWSVGLGRSWYGSNAKHVQDVLANFQAASPFLKEKAAVPVAGLRGVETGHSVFVLPAGSGGTIGSQIGQERWSFADGVMGYDVGSRFHMREGSVDPETLLALHKLHIPGVMTPLLAWMATVPLRSLCKNYPPLAVLGGSGSGKTTLTLAVMRYLWGWSTAEMNLTNSTPYAVKQASASTNGLPIWWDEHRRGARRDALEAVSQVLRDSWTGSVSQRGGVGDDKTRVEQTAAVAPLIISGEAGFEERSLIDRTIMLRLPLHGKDPGALERVVGDPGVGVVGRRLITWLMDLLDMGDPLVTAGVPGRLDRQAQGVAVLEWGWEIWKRFLEEEFGLRMEWGLDLGVVTTERAYEDETPEITALVEILQTGAGETFGDRVPVAWIEDEWADVVAVRKQAFYRAASKLGYVLPGGQQAAIRVLLDRFPSLGDRAMYKNVIGDGFQVRAERISGFLAYCRGEGIDLGSGHSVLPEDPGL